MALIDITLTYFERVILKFHTLGANFFVMHKVSNAQVSN